MLYKFLLFSILPCCAICTAAFCDCTNLGSNHQCDAGKYWTGTACTTCPPGYYCNGNGWAYCCPEPFTKTPSWYDGHVINNNATGTTSIHSCYAEITCGTDKFYIGCYGHWDETNRKCPPPTLNDDKPNVQWAYNYTSGSNPTTPLLPKERSDWLNGYLDTGNFNNHDSINTTYHIEVKAKYTDQPYNGGNLGYIWKEDSVAEIMCVQNTIYCSTLNQYGTLPYDCTQHDDNQAACNSHLNDGCIWISTNNLQNKCVYRDDVGATAANTHCPSGNITGAAHWVSQDDENNTLGFGYWDVSACKCGFNNQLNDSMHCYGNGSYPIMENTPISIVHSVGEHIIFNPEAHSSDFVCTKCQAGPYYVPGNDDNVVIVTGCEPVPSYGFWRKPKHNGYCNDDNNNGTTWTYPLDGNPCPLKSCPAGKTTTEYGPIGSDSCHYTDQTKFCDANGCFNITDAADGGWDWD